MTDKEIAERTKLWMVKLNRAANPDDAEEVRRNLIALGPKAVPTIVEQADADTHHAPFIHWNVCLALGKMADDRAVPYLLKRIEPVSPADLKAKPEWGYVRTFAVLALGKIPDPARMAVPPIKKILNDEQEALFIRRACCLALGTLRDEPALETLAKLLTDANGPSTLRAAAALGLGMLPSDAASAKLLGYLGQDEKTRDPLTDRMTVLAVGLQRKDNTAPKLRPLLRGGDQSLRGTACLVLGWLNDRASTPDIITVLEDENAPAFTRCNAAVALNGLGKPEQAGAFLRKVLEDDTKKHHPGTLANAAIALGEIAGDENLKTQVTLINEHRYPVVTLNAVNALGHRKDKLMIKFLCDKFYEFKGTANQYLRGEIVRALLSHPPQEAVRALFFQALKDQSPFVRMKAAIALARYPGTDTEKQLFECLDDKDEQVRGEASLSLGVLKSKGAVPALRKLLEDPSDWVRFRTRKALENVLKYGENEFWQAAGVQALIEERLRVIGGNLKEEMDRMYTEGYRQVLELDKAYRPGTAVR